MASRRPSLGLLLSYVCEVISLPRHAKRLADLRWARNRACYQAALGMEQELESLRQAVRVARKMEREIEQMDLTFHASQRVAGKALLAALDRLEQRVAASFPEVQADAAGSGEP